MKMERGPSYTEYEDVVPESGDNGQPVPSSKGLVKRINVPTDTGRIMDRKDQMFKRSKGQWNIRRQKVPHYWKLYMQDPFHTVVNMRLSKVLGSLVFAYIVVIVLFGALYMTPPDHCKLAISSFFGGFSFSVSVLFTIGFGTNGGDVFFGQCIWVQTIITLESFCGILLDALAIGIIFQRFSRAQVCEMRKHQLVEAHVRMYAIRHDVEFGEHYYFQSYPMRIQHPDDDLGGMMLLALPSVVVHRMDAWSPLLRPKGADTCGSHHNPARGYLFPEPLCREADAQSGDRDGSVQVATKSEHNTCRCLTNNVAASDVHAATEPPTIEEIKQYWAECQMEVVVLVEGIDAVTSTTIQVRHSYKAEDIMFNHRHVNCVDVDPATGGAVIDFNLFHETKPVDPECNKVAGSFY